MGRWIVNGVAASILVAVLALAAFVYLGLPSLLVDDDVFTTGTPAAVEREQQRLKARNDVRTSGLALLTVVGLAAGSVLTWRTLRLTREGQLADRYARSMEALAKSEDGAHVGAVLSLEVVARSSREHHVRVTKLLEQELRRAAGSWQPADAVGATRIVSPKLDALAVAIGRRRARWDREPLDLSGLDLRNVRWTRADLRGANLTASNLGGAFLEHARLERTRGEGAHLVEAHVQHARFRRADLTDAVFDRARVDGADFRRAIQTRTSFTAVKGTARGLG